MDSRKQKIILGTVMAGYMTLVCFNNLADYNTNYVFLSKVSSMEDLISGTTNVWRSIQMPWMHHLMYIFVILSELTIAYFLWKGVFAMLRKVKSSQPDFVKAKEVLLTGLTFGVILWLGMFIGIAGEWFLMWQSKTWNAQQTAFFLSIVFLLIRINIASNEA